MHAFVVAAEHRTCSKQTGGGGGGGGGDACLALSRPCLFVTRGWYVATDIVARSHAPTTTTAHTLFGRWVFFLGCTYSNSHHTNTTFKSKLHSLMLSVLATYTHSRSLTNSNPVCDATRQVYLNNACCGEGGGSAVCVSPSMAPSAPATSFQDCVIAIRSTQSLPRECRDVLRTHSTTRAKLSGSQVGQEDSNYSHFVSNPRAGANSSSTVRFVFKSKGLISSDAAANGDPFRNFQHSMTLTPEFLLLGVRDTPGLNWYLGNTASLSGVYKFDRESMRLLDYFGGPADAPYAVMRYAPLVAENFVFSTTTGLNVDPSSVGRFFYRTPLSDFSTSAKRDVGIDFDLTQSLSGIAGPIASQKADNTCGTRMYLSTTGFAYAPFIGGTEPQTRAMAIGNEVGARGRIGCYCSKTMAPCPTWNSYYFNGKADGTGLLPTPVAVVTAKHLNTQRSTFMGTVRQVRCADLTPSSSPFTASNVIPLAFVVTFNASVPTDTVLSGVGANRATIQLRVGNVATLDHHVSYWAGHYDTPVIGMVLKSAAGQYVALQSVSQVVLDHAYVTHTAIAGQTGYSSIFPGGITTSIATMNTAYTIASFDDVLDLGSLSATCATTLNFTSVKTEHNGHAKDVDLSGISVKQKFSLGDTIPLDGRMATFTTGSDSFNAAPVDDEEGIMYAAFGNAYVNSFDRHQVMQPVMQLQKQNIAARVAAISASPPDLVALKAANQAHAQVLALVAQQRATLSEFDMYFAEDAVHAIETVTGKLKWATMLEGTDPAYFGGLNIAPTTNYVRADASSALAFESYGDYDVNNVAFMGNVVYASTKGGTMALLDRGSGALLRVHKYAPGLAAGGASPGNYGGTCVTSTGIMVGFATAATSAINTPTGPYAWVMESGLPILKGNSMLVAWDPVRDIELWSLQIHSSNSVGGISCVEESVLALCPEGMGMCNYDARTGAILQTLIPDPVIDNPASENLLGTNIHFSTKSMICDGPECFAWNDGPYASKYIMV